MIELTDMAKLVNDDVFCQMFWDEGDFIIEIYTPRSRTASPSCLLITDTDIFVCKIVYLVVVLYFILREGTRLFFV